MFTALLISPVPERAQILQSCALEAGNVLILKRIEHYPHGPEIARLLNLVQPEVVLVDLEPPGEAAECARRMKLYCPKAPFIGFGEWRDGTEVAWAEVLDVALPFPPEETLLARTVEEWIRRRRGGTAENLVAFVPAKGGSGTTTVLLHTAMALAAAKKVLVIEADLWSAALSLMLHVEADGSLQEVVRQAGNVSGVRFGQAITPVENVDFLLSDGRVPEPPLSWVDYFRLLETATPSYDFVLADLPEYVDPAAREILLMAGQVFVVTTPEVVTVKLAQRICGELLKWGVAGQRVQVLVNRWESGELNARQFQEILGRPVAQTFPNDPRSVKTAILRASPIPAETELGRCVYELAGKLGGLAAPACGSLGGKIKQLLHLEAGHPGFRRAG